jgi:nitric oxide reductase activation protein
MPEHDWPSAAELQQFEDRSATARQISNSKTDQQQQDRSATA